MTDADMTRPEPDNFPKDPEHRPAVEPAQAGEADELGGDEQGDHDTAEVDQTGGKIANPYMTD
jgi:hypothetical protein